MKKLLLIALIAFGAPAFAEPEKSCQMTTLALYQRAIAGADRELLKYTLEDQYKNLLSMTDSSSLEYLYNMLMGDIYADIGTKKIYKEPLDGESVFKFIKSTCSHDYMLDFFK